jgi:hypothetical protein
MMDEVQMIYYDNIQGDENVFAKENKCEKMTQPTLFTKCC